MNGTRATPPLVLASASPRRKELLSSLRLAFLVDPADVDETRFGGEDPAALALRLATSKAAVVASRHPDAVVIAADTVVAIDGGILEKPSDRRENARFLRTLAGRSHTVHTGHAVAWAGRQHARVVSSRVTFRDLDEREIEWYASTGEGLDKAGGYAIQGYGAVIVREIEGDYFNVVGLSLANLVELAREAGVDLVGTDPARALEGANADGRS